MYHQPTLFDNEPARHDMAVRHDIAAEHAPVLQNRPQQPVIANIPAMTKAESYHSAATKRLRVTQKDRILSAVQQLCRPSQSEIHRETGIPRHLIPDRINTLLKEGRVKVAGYKRDEHTNKDVTVYEAVR